MDEEKTAGFPDPSFASSTTANGVFTLGLPEPAAIRAEKVVAVVTAHGSARVHDPFGAIVPLIA